MQCRWSCAWSTVFVLLQTYFRLTVPRKLHYHRYFKTLSVASKEKSFYSSYKRQFVHLFTFEFSKTCTNGLIIAHPNFTHSKAIISVPVWVSFDLIPSIFVIYNQPKGVQLTRKVNDITNICDCRRFSQNDVLVVSTVF